MSLDDLVIPNPINTSDRVRELRGMKKIDGSKIEGFGAGEAPMPSFNNPYPPIPQEPVASSTPTADYNTPTWTNFSVNVAPEVPAEDIAVWYQGKKLAPNQALLNQVERLILTELQREVASKLKSLSDKPKRRRAIKAMNPVETPKPAEQAPDAPTAPPRKRGRPPGAKNKVKPEPKDVTHEEPVESDLTA